MKKTKIYLRIFWVALVLIGLALFFLYPEKFTHDSISAFVKENSTKIFSTYIGICLIRGLFLLPSTPFIFAGVLLFPESPWTVFWISMFGIMTTSIYLYFASKFLEFGNLFGQKHNSRKTKIIEKLDKHGFWVVLGWSFFPLVPTDLICYIAGSTRMNFIKYISAIFIGESILVACYIFLGESILKLI
ncbi:TVP38/TMEM64 family protein [Aureibaculum algae]|uniref:TVP38/TMEM64 family membrane protein n=1 Tax=Aureibaculum algae TaxID=2584122 RepID=A0A5B7TL04_9FLAO|nr:VTT domain-containing protein [Aureibaculum algae]QCX36915.1 TVP38/TMEM64 family protein [Aureibaculum algae]